MIVVSTGMMLVSTRFRIGMIVIGVISLDITVKIENKPAEDGIATEETTQNVGSLVFEHF